MKHWTDRLLSCILALSFAAVVLLHTNCGGTGGSCADCIRQEVQVRDHNKPGHTPSCEYHGIWVKPNQTTFSCGVPTFRSGYNDCWVFWQSRTIDRNTCPMDCFDRLWNEATGEFVSGISEQEDPVGFYLKSGPCVGPVVEVPSTPENLVFTAPNTLTWKQSRKDKTGSGTNPPDKYMVVWDAGTIDQAKFETLRTKTAGTDQQAVNVTPTTLATQTVELPISGEFYVRIRAENANGNSELSEQIKVTVVGTGSIAFTPRLIPKSGVERVKMVATGEVFATNMTLKINDIEVSYERDRLVDNVVYFTPPVPGTTTSFAVVLENHPTIGSTLNLGTQKLIANVPDPSDAFRSILAGARVRLEENFAIIKKKKDDGGYTPTPDFTAAEIPANELIQVALSELKITQFFVDDFINAYGTLSTGTMDQNQRDLEAVGAENNVYLTARVEDLVGPIQADPVLLKTGAESGYWGQADFFSHYIHEMEASGKDYIAGQLPEGGATSEIKWVLIRAAAYQLNFQTYTTAGKTIASAIQDNPTARVILNGAMFGPKGTDKKPIPFKISGQMWINCVEPTVSSHFGEPGYIRGNKLWNFVQKADLSYAYGSGNPTAPPNTDCNTPGTTKTATGGLYAFNIGPYGSPLRYTQDPNLTKLQNYQIGKHRTPGPLKALAHSFGGFAGISHYTDVSDNKEYLLFFAKQQWLVKVPIRLHYTHTLWDIENDLSKMKVEWTVGVDGGPVVAMAFNDGTGLNAVAKSWNHWYPVAPNDVNTTPSYVVFK